MGMLAGTPRPIPTASGSGRGRRRISISQISTGSRHLNAGLVGVVAACPVESAKAGVDSAKKSAAPIKIGVMISGGFRLYRLTATGTRLRKGAHQRPEERSLSL